MKKPYLASIGIGIPLFGVWMHRYVLVKRKIELHWFSFLGVKVVITSYKRLEKEI